MCHDWWDEGLNEGRFRLNKDQAEKLRRVTEGLVLPRRPKQEQKPALTPQTQPDAVPV